MFADSEEEARSAAPNQRAFSLEAIMGKLLQAFKAKDAYGFFLAPVDTDVVTDYTAVIKSPMDLGTMEKRLEAHAYHNLREFQSDFELICSNAMIYNAPNTIYYRNAQKLLHFGRKLVAKESLKWNEKLNASESGKRRKAAHALGDFNYALNEDDYHLLASKRPATALYRKTNDGSLVFSSLLRRPNIAALNLSYKQNGSIDLGNDVTARQLIINPLHEGFASKKLPLLGNSTSILTAYVKSRALLQRHTHDPHDVLPGSVEYNNPFCSFSPFFDSAGHPIPNFESSILALVYGDPKGKAYIQSFEYFLNESLNVSGASYLKDHIQRLCDALTEGGHAYVKNVEEWKESIFAQKKAVVDKKPPSSETMLLPTANVHRTDMASNHLHEQVRTDLNQLARLLRWKRIEPEFEKLSQEPSTAIVNQFLKSQLPRTTPGGAALSEPSDAAPEALPVDIQNIDERLQQSSSLIIALQDLQNKRFKSPNPSAVTLEEKSLVRDLKQLLVGLAVMTLPQEIAPSFEAVSRLMSSMADTEKLPSYSGTLPDHV